MRTARLAIGALALFGVVFVIAWSVLAQGWDAPSVVVPEEPATELLVEAPAPEPLSARTTHEPGAPEGAATLSTDGADQRETADAPEPQPDDKPGAGTESAAAKPTAQQLQDALLKRWIVDSNKLGSNAGKVIYKAPDTRLGEGLSNAVTFKTITGTVTGQVLDPWGVPIKGASVSSMHAGALTSSSAYVAAVNGQFKLQAGAVTDENGMFRLTVNEITFGDSDEVTIKAVAHGYSSSEPLKVKLDPKQASSGHVLRLRPAASLEGYVVDSRGSAVAGVTVMLAGQGAAPATKTDAAGRFRFDPVGAGIYVVIAKGPGVKQDGNPTGITIEPGTATRLPKPITVDLAPCVVGRLQDLKGKAPARSAMIRYVDDKGKTKTRNVKVASDGTFWLELAAGRYDLEIVVKGHESARVIAYVTDGPYDVGTITVPASQ